jgi:hypothetical protein
MHRRPCHSHPLRGPDQNAGNTPDDTLRVVNQPVKHLNHMTDSETPRKLPAGQERRSLHLRVRLYASLPMLLAFFVSLLKLISPCSLNSDESPLQVIRHLDYKGKPTAAEGLDTGDLDAVLAVTAATALVLAFQWIQVRMLAHHAFLLCLRRLSHFHLRRVSNHRKFTSAACRY